MSYPVQPGVMPAALITAVAAGVCEIVDQRLGGVGFLGVGGDAPT